MRYLIVAAVVLASSACAHYRDPAEAAYPTKRDQREAEERARDSVGRMQDEFNQLFPNG
jgi:hypothetical protein